METLRFRVAADTEKSQELTFHLVSETDEILLTGGGFADREACVAGIQAVIDVVSDKERYAIESGAEGAVLTLTGADNLLLAQSAALPDESAALALRDGLTETASEQEEYDIALPGTQSGRTVTALPFRETAAVDPATLYDFSRASIVGQAGFEPVHIAGEERFYFHVNDASGMALLYSREFRSASQRNQRMRMVAKSGVLKQRYERRAEDGRHFFFLKARNGQEIARSRAFASSADMEAALAWLLIEMAVFAEAFTRRSAPRTRRKDGFNLALLSLTTAVGFELLRDAADKLYYFIFHAQDGTALMFSQGYATRAGRDKAIQTLIRLSANSARYEAVQTKEGHAFAIRARNNQLIAHSRAFDDEAAAGAAMAVAQASILTYAAAYGVGVEELETGQEERLTLHADREKPDDPILLPITPITPVLPVAPVAFAIPAIAAVPVESAAPTVPETSDEADHAAALPLLAGAAVITPQAETEIPPAPEASVESPPAPKIEAPASLITAPAAPASGARPPADDSRRKTGGYLWAGGALLLLLLLLLFAVPFFLNRGRQAGAGNSEGAVASSRGQGGTSVAVSPPSPVGQRRSALPPSDTSHREPGRVTAANGPALPGSRTPSPANTAIASAAHQGHSGSDMMKMETALAAYLSGPASAEPRAFTMNRLAYPPNSHEVNPAGKDEIRDLAHVLTRFPKAKIVLHGHLDGTEKEAYSGPNPRLGYPLSKLRPDCVCRRLHFLGVSYDRMQIVGDGSARPAGDDSTADGRQQNRRIDITVAAR